MAVAAHRGASYTAPENTLAANRVAFEQGAAGVEFDVQTSADGEIFLLHDDTLSRTASRSCPRELCVDAGMSESEYLSALEQDTKTLSYKDFIKYVDVGSWKGEEYASERPATLREAMAEIPADRFVLCEMKTDDVEAGQAVVSMAAAEGWPASQFRIIGFDLVLMQEMKKLFLRAGLFEHKVWFLKRAYFPWEASAGVREAIAGGLDGVNFNAWSLSVTTSVVSAAKEANLEVAVYVQGGVPFSDTPFNAGVLEGRGVDVFTSDLPPSMQEWVAERR